jgi:hypothetical protein
MCVGRALPLCRNHTSMLLLGILASPFPAHPLWLGFLLRAALAARVGVRCWLCGLQCSQRLPLPKDLLMPGKSAC